MSTTIDETRCPLCGENNACLNVSLNACLKASLNVSLKVKQSGGSENKCWCSDDSISFPAELIAQVPGHLKRKACICQSCAEQHLKK